MKLARALIYAALGGLMVLMNLKNGNDRMAYGIGFFALCAIIVALTDFGRTRISWDNSGITIKRAMKPERFIGWSELQKLRADHMGYHVKSRKGNFRISKNKMPKDLLAEIRRNTRS